MKKNIKVKLKDEIIQHDIDKKTITNYKARPKTSKDTQVRPFSSLNPKDKNDEKSIGMDEVTNKIKDMWTNNNNFKTERVKRLRIRKHKKR